MKIDVTQEIIDEAIKRRYITPLISNCPVALALQQAGFPKVQVGLTGWCNLGNDQHSIHLGSDVGQRVDQFTVDNEMEPFSFELPDYLSPRI